MSNKGVHWSVSDEKIAVDMLAESKSFLQVAEKLGRSISSVTAHFDKFFFETYHLKKALKLWKRFNNKYANHNSDEIDISNLKKKDEVYFYNCTGVSDTLLHRRLRNVVCIGWMKCKIRQIDIGRKRIKIKHSVYKTDEWIYLNEGKIRLNGNGLYCYDWNYNNICFAEKCKEIEEDFSSRLIFEDSPSAFKMQQIVNCSCNKLMKKTTIKSNSFLSNKKQNGEIIECISCKKNVEQAHYSLYFSDEKNDIHSTVCVICWVCADKQQYAKVCKKIKIPFYEFETKEKSAKIISNLITINNKLTKELLINKLKTNRSYIW
eukprot:444197_1